MLTERTVISLFEVTPNGTIQVRLANQILDGETVKAQIFHRYCLAPGSDLTGQPDQVVAIANAVWTPEVISAYEAQVAANQNPIGA
jgi:hypothetical protein